MAKVTLAQNSFTAGEIAPRVSGRKDMDRYQQGMKLCRNAHPVIHGGFRRRTGTMHAANAYSNFDNDSVLVPFVEGQGLAWMLEFGHNQVKIFDVTGAYTGITLASPYTASQLALIDWAQSDSTLWTVHPAVIPYRLQRLATNVWVFAAAPFTTMPFDEVGRFPATTLTLSALTVGVGRTATAGAPSFLQAYVGRAIVCDAGIAVITGYTSTTVVTVEITRAFAASPMASGAWKIEGSPQCYLYPRTAKPVGVTTYLYTAATRAAGVVLSDVTGTITVTADASVFVVGDVNKSFFAGSGMATITGYTSGTQITVAAVTNFDTKDYGATQWGVSGVAAFDSNDVGAMVRVDGGLARITEIVSADKVKATILRELAGSVLAPPLSWSLEPPAWSSRLGYPRSVTIHQQRSIFAGSDKFPRTVWGSRTGEPLDFERWTGDADSFAWTIDGDEATAIRFITSVKHLAVLTDSAEYSMRSGVEKPLTPTNVRVEPESVHGTAQVRPAQVNKEQLFVQQPGKKVRLFGYRYDFDSYNSPDISALANHLVTTGVTGMTYAKEPEQLVYAVTGDGGFVTCTIDRDQEPSVIGWGKHSTLGFVECMQTIPGPVGSMVWAIVRRTVNGVQERHIEYFDETFEPVREADLPEALDEMPIYGCMVDAGAEFDSSEPVSDVNVPHLVGNKVAVLADGCVVWDGFSDDSPVVPIGGEIPLPRPAKKVLVGLPYRTEGRFLTPEVQTGAGSSQGKAMHTGELWLEFLETVGAKVQSLDGEVQTLPFRNFGPGILDQMPLPFTGGMQLSMLGWERGRAEVSVFQDQPLPLHVLAAVRTHQVGGI